MGGWVQTHLEWPEEQVEFSGFDVHREATDKQCPDLGTETTVVRAKLTEEQRMTALPSEGTRILPGLKEELRIS